MFCNSLEKMCEEIKNIEKKEVPEVNFWCTSHLTEFDQSGSSQEALLLCPGLGNFMSAFVPGMETLPKKTTSE